MSVEVLLPQRGMGMKEATIVRWHVHEGDFVHEGDKLVDVESSKATDEILAPASGVVSQIRYKADEEVEVGEILALILPAEEAEPCGSKDAHVEDVVKPEKEELFIPLQGEMTHIRQVTAERMLQSVQSTAPVTLHIDADVTETVKRREALKSESGVTYTDILIKVVAQTLKRHPKLCLVWENGKPVRPNQVNIGVAVDLDDGLVVPVLRDADQKSLSEIHNIVSELSGKARQGTLTSDELSGGTFTITNLGMHGVDYFTPIINPPESGILGIGRIKKRVLVVQEEIAVRSVMGLSLTFDHRMVDGVPAAEFLGDICAALEASEF